MTHRQMAIDIVRSMYDNGSTDSNEVYRESDAKRCALAFADFCIKWCEVENLEYWLKVKIEIEQI